MTRVCEKIPQLTFTNAGHSGQTMKSALGYSEIVSGYDIYTIMFGTNDFSRFPVGTYDDYINRTVDTIYGNFAKLMDKVTGVANGAPILVMTTTHWGCPINVSNPTGIIGQSSDVQVNQFGNKLDDLQNAVLDACQKNNIPYVDLFHESHITPKNA